MTARNTAKRSIYMDQSTAHDVQELADAHLRTWSKQLEWLVRLGLHASHLLPTDMPGLDEGRARKYFYPGDIVEQLDALLVEKNVYRSEGAKPWSFSALIRVLLSQGIRIERQFARSLDAAMARLDVAAKGVDPAPRELAMTLISSRSTTELLGLLDEDAPAELVVRWGQWVQRSWVDIIRTALECRGRIDTLEST